MDEPMSALDGKSETEFLQTVEDLRKEMGRIVAHGLRLRGIQIASACWRMVGWSSWARGVS